MDLGKCPNVSSLEEDEAGVTIGIVTNCQRCLLGTSMEVVWLYYACCW